ncbi:peptidase M24, structural domain-containing protein [Polychytrium aggregatum]|uniref:peptidase M24, structural domain-containing protein n=1 Tax=Polychytrium aggregatum TaxID=110093 RepID=UPI0022FEBDB7|nr:peptidase M24, structural domain-containing protein [Polychytrium aggregatum]KAI9193136.1 peptidase M24, structural domain-containing protein [Polychytrium aggregatum]
MPVDTAARLAALRAELAREGIQAFIIPAEDAHQSEYIAAHDGRREFISGFSGSAGLAVVTTDKAALWTDGRYFLQASQQLDSNWILQKAGLPNVPTKEEWLLDVLPPSSKIGVDPKLLTVAAARVLAESLSKKNHQIVYTTANLVDSVWSDQPTVPTNPVAVHPIQYAGSATSEKIATLREKIAAKNAWGFAVTALDEIAWLFNLRGSDISYNPVFFSYALVTKDQVILYIDESKLSEEVRQHLGEGVLIRPYTAIFTDLPQYAAQYLAEDQKLWIDSRCNVALQSALGGSQATIESRSPIMDMKAIKNETELEGFRQSHIRDGAALIEYFAWLEHELNNNHNTTIDEVAAADKLEGFRSTKEKFVGLSFDTISSIGANGAIIHYKPTPGACATVNNTEIYLCDSGAQYLDGTTDTTRTLHFGTPTEEEKDAFTRVLKGHIQLDLAVFPRGTTGYVLDVLARTALWKGGLDYRHGTGHGVGSYLNVHEGPHGIGIRIGYNDIPLAPGMVISNEPGFYNDGKFGIRIENIILVKEVETPNNFGGVGYLGFEHVTLVPIQRRLIKVELLTPEERDWVNSYHQEILQKVSPLLSENGLALEWLKRETLPI